MAYKYVYLFSEGNGSMMPYEPSDNSESFVTFLAVITPSPSQSGRQRVLPSARILPSSGMVSGLRGVEQNANTVFASLYSGRETALSPMAAPIIGKTALLALLYAFDKALISFTTAIPPLGTVDTILQIATKSNGWYNSYNTI